MTTACPVIWSLKTGLSVNVYQLLTLSPPITTKIPYANSLELDETLRNSASCPDSGCLTLRLHLHKLWATEALWALRQTRNLAEDNLFGGLRVKLYYPFAKFLQSTTAESSCRSLLHNLFTVIDCHLLLKSCVLLFISFITCVSVR